MDFGNTIREARKNTGLSLRKCAKHLEMSPSYLSKLETGAMPPPSVSYIVRIADLLNLDMDMLLGSTGQISPDLVEKLLQNPALSAKLRDMK